MKFDFIIGNPPYQEETKDTSDKPVYHYMMDAAYAIGNKVELITPARFLFCAGKTPNDWNQKMLSDEHLKVKEFQPNAQDVFPTTGFKGGVVITYRDTEQVFGAIESFTPFSALNGILYKVKPFLVSGVLSDCIYLQNKLDLDALYVDYPESVILVGSGGREQRIVSNAFTRLPVFSDNRMSLDDIQIYGVSGSEHTRVYKFVNSKYVRDNGNLNKYKVFVPKSNGSGALGEVLSTPVIGQPVIGQPVIGHTQTFLSIGAFDTEQEAEACLKYVKSKFARVMLGICKVTQDNPPKTWRYVPLQNFTANSDIDWSQSVAEIDQQLYKKYGLDASEIEFIETHVMAME